MAGYTRQSTLDIQPDKVVKAEPFNAEFDALAGAFGTSGHTHNGTAGNGPKLDINDSTTGILPASRVDISPPDLSEYVKGPASSTNGIITIFLGSTGKAIQSSGVTVANIRDRNTHTGTQNISTINGLQTQLDLKVDRTVADNLYEVQVQNWQYKATDFDHTDTRLLWLNQTTGMKYRIAYSEFKGVLQQSLDVRYAPISHTHTPAQVGLGNVNNTSDANKPVSTATQNALNGKANQWSVSEVGFGGTGGNNKNDPYFKHSDGSYIQLALRSHTHTPSEVGLGNVNNTSDANKPISTATQTALNGKQNNLGYTPINKAGDTFTGDVNIPYCDFRKGTAYTQQGLQGYGWGSGFVPWRLILNGDESLSWWNYNPNDGNVRGQRMMLSSGGNLAVNGSISKGSGTFLIDHPLDPTNKNLRHGFVEAPEYLNVYRGTVKLVNGRASVDIDQVFNMSSGTFWALNTDVVVSSLQNNDSFSRVKPDGKMTSGILNIVCEDETSTDEISWMVTGRRKDPFVILIDGNCERGTGKLIPEFEKED